MKKTVHTVRSQIVKNQQNRNRIELVARPEVLVVVEGVSDDELVGYLEASVVRGVLVGQGRPLAEQRRNSNTPWAVLKRRNRQMPNRCFITAFRNSVFVGFRNTLLRVLRSFVMVRPVSIMSSKITMFFPERLASADSSMPIICTSPADLQIQKNQWCYQDYTIVELQLCYR